MPIKRHPAHCDLIDEYQRVAQKPSSRSVAEFWHPTGSCVGVSLTLAFVVCMLSDLRLGSRQFSALLDSSRNNVVPNVPDLPRTGRTRLHHGKREQHIPWGASRLFLVYRRWLRRLKDRIVWFSGFARTLVLSVGSHCWVDIAILEGDPRLGCAFVVFGNFDIDILFF